ncbi:MAG: cytochrome c biogenesis protein [Anaerolineae bacterium]
MPLPVRRPRSSVPAVLLLALVLIALVYAPGARAQGVVHLYYFFDPDCSSCHVVQQDVLDPLIAAYGEGLVIERRDITDVANFDLMLDLETRFQAASSSIPEVVIGDRVLAGEEQIRTELKPAIEHYLAQGGVLLPETSAPGASPTTADCDECRDTHQAARDARATRQAEASLSRTTVVRALLFWSPTCPHCHVVKDEVLPPLQEQYGAQLDIVPLNITEPAAREFWYLVLGTYQVPSERQAVPMLILADKVLMGSREIPEQLPGLIAQHLSAGGVDLPAFVYATGMVAPLPTATPTSTPTPQPAEPAPIHVAYFFQPGCDQCERSEHDLAYIQVKYPQVVIHRFNVKDEAARNQYLCENANVPESKHLTAPALFVGNAYLAGEQVRARAVEDLLAPYLQNGAPEPWQGWETRQTAAAQTIVERFRSFGLLTVVGAGLLDGVNPCAFATMIFLLSYLSLNKRKGRALLATGAAFTLGVFLTYLGVGFGFLRFLSSLPFLHIIGKWVYGVTVLLCLALAWGSIVDYRRAKAGRLEDMSLKLPDRMRGWIKALVRKGSSARRFVLSAFALGFAVSVVELACTGQVYLPTIVFVLGIPEWRGQASLALLLYNIMFVLPLIGVFLLVYFGTTSQQLIDWMTRHTATIKLGMASLFLMLAGWLSYSIVAL